MAGEWIKMRLDLASDPGVNRIRKATGIDADAIVGKLHRLWSWADVHTTDGIASGVDIEWLDEFTGAVGFAEGMILAGWLECDTNYLRFLNFDRHNGLSAKRRCTQKTRVERSRAQSVTVPALQNAHTLRTDCAPEKRREEKNKNNTNTAPSGSRSAPDSISWDSAQGWIGITDADRDAWLVAYPAATLPTELAKAGEWLKSNETKARRSNWRKFLTNWLSRCQDGGGTRSGTQQQAPPTPQAKRRYWRDKYTRNMTEEEFRLAEQSSAEVKSLAAALEVR
jgi:hypothetical protein